MVEYTVRAQFTTVRANDLVTDMRLPNRFKHVSKFRGHRKIQVCSPWQKHLNSDLLQKIEVRIGGVLGFGASKSNITVCLT